MKVKISKFNSMCNAVQWLLYNSGYDTENQDALWWEYTREYIQKQVYIIANKDLSNELLDGNITPSQIDNIKRILGE